MGEHGKVMSKRYQKLNATKRQTFFHYHSKVLFNVFLVTSTSFRVIFFVYSKLLTFDVCLWIKAKQVVCKWGFLEGCGYGLETFAESRSAKFDLRRNDVEGSEGWASEASVWNICVLWIRWFGRFEIDTLLKHIVIGSEDKFTPNIQTHVH